VLLVFNFKQYPTPNRTANDKCHECSIIGQHVYNW